MNKNIPAIQCLVRKEFLHDQQEGHGQFVPCWIFAVRSVKGLALQFYALLETGAMFTGLPLNAFCTSVTAPKLELGVSQLWDNLSNDIDVVELSFIKGMDCCVFLKNQEKTGGEYLFTIDYSHQDPNITNVGLSHTPNEWKGLHVIETYDGNFVAYPPNRIFFKDASLTLPDTDPSKEGYRLNTQTWKCEDGNKWSVGDSEEFFYGEKAEDDSRWSFKDHNGNIWSRPLSTGTPYEIEEDEEILDTEDDL